MEAISRFRQKAAFWLAASVKGLLMPTQALAASIRDRILEDWMPEQLSGWRKAGNETLPWVRFETIYAWIFTGVTLAEKLWKYLPDKKVTR